MQLQVHTVSSKLINSRKHWVYQSYTLLGSKFDRTELFIVYYFHSQKICTLKNMQVAGVRVCE